MINPERLTEVRRQDFYDHFGHLDVETRFKVVEFVRDAYLDGETLPSLASRLQEEMLIVPGDNQVSLEQLNAAINGYLSDKDEWDRRIRIMKGLE